MKSRIAAFILMLAAFTLLSPVVSSPVWAECNEDYIRNTQSDCQSICVGGTCVQVGGTGGVPLRWQCTSCPAPATTTSTRPNCREACDAVTDFDDQSRLCGSLPSCTSPPPSGQQATVLEQCTAAGNSLTECRAAGLVSYRDTTALRALYSPGTSLPSEQECVETGLGCIPTNPTQFAGWLLGWGIGLGTLLAVVFLTIGGIGVATSAGNPDNLEKAKKQITAAIAGLVFILLSVLILNTIGGGIIQIPFFQQ